MPSKRKIHPAGAFFAAFSLTAAVLFAIFGSLTLFWERDTGQQASAAAQGIPAEDPARRLLAGQRKNLLCTVTDGDTPLLCAVLGFSPESRDITVFCLPLDLSSAVAGEPMTLAELYGYAGENLWRLGVEETAGLSISRQAAIDVNGVRTLIDATGALRYDVPWQVEANHITLTPGTRELDGAKTYAYLKGLAQLRKKGQLEESALLQEQTRFLLELLRQNFNEYNTQRTLGYYDELFPVLRTDITLKDMVRYAPVLQELGKDCAFSPFYPKGTWDEETGTVTLTEECRQKIAEVFSLETGEALTPSVSG